MNIFDIHKDMYR